MQNYITLSQLNDFIFCPYSIYLHNVYAAGDEDNYHSTPQTQGRASHTTIDKKKRNGLTGLPVYSEELGICGKIDIYEPKEKLLIERKHRIVQVYQGQIYQLWGQYFCMLEMGYAIEQIELYSISTNQHFPVAIPDEANKVAFIGFINKFKYFNPSQNIPINYNKCRHCIYCNLCDKVEIENVYS